MFTREQLSDLQTIIQETISKLMRDDTFFKVLVTNIEEKLQIKQMQQKIDDLTKKVEKLKEEKEEEIKIMAEKIEKMEQHRKRKSIRIYGVIENNRENVIEKALEVLNGKLKLNLRDHDLENCFRIGKTRNGKRPIMIGFTKENVKKAAVQNRGKLKGTGISVTEDVTPAKYKLFKEAKEKLGKENVWILGGEIRAQIDQQRHVIRSKAQLDQFSIPKPSGGSTDNNRPTQVTH